MDPKWCHINHLYFKVMFHHVCLNEWGMYHFNIKIWKLFTTIKMMMDKISAYIYIHSISLLVLSGDNCLCTLIYFMQMYVLILQNIFYHFQVFDKLQQIGVSWTKASFCSVNAVKRVIRRAKLHPELFALMDEKSKVSDLISIKPWTHSANRKIWTFSNNSETLVGNIDPAALWKWFS